MTILAVGTEAAQAGTHLSTARALARTSHSWTYRPNGATRHVRVALKGDGDTDLDVYVYNSQGALVAYDSDFSDLCAVRFWALRGGTYRIVVVNRGNVYNRYVMRIDD